MREKHRQFHCEFFSYACKNSVTACYRPSFWKHLRQFFTSLKTKLELDIMFQILLGISLQNGFFRKFLWRIIWKFSRQIYLNTMFVLYDSVILSTIHIEVRSEYAWELLRILLRKIHKVILLEISSETSFSLFWKLILAILLTMFLAIYSEIPLTTFQELLWKFLI